MIERPTLPATYRLQAELIEAAKNMHESYRKVSKALGAGATRRAYDLGDCVVKIPACHLIEYIGTNYISPLSMRLKIAKCVASGNIHNWLEREHYRNGHPVFSLAEVLDYQVIDGLHISFQERLTEFPPGIDHISYDNLRKFYPEWIWDAPDGGQGGFDKDGVFKLYDYADIGKRFDFT